MGIQPMPRRCAVSRLPVTAHPVLEIDFGAVVLTAIDRRFPRVFVACRHLLHTEEAAVNDDFHVMSCPLIARSSLASVSICIILGCFPTA